jgi:ComF family protein
VLRRFFSLSRLRGRVGVGALSALTTGARAALDLLLPPHCLTCDAPVDAPGRFCPDCFALTGFVTEPCCRRCGVPFAHAGQGGREKLCPACRERPPPWGRARAALRYDTQAKRIVLPLKYGDRTEYASALAPLMARAGAALLRDAQLLVPVPLHRRRLIQRRYNRAALLAGAVARLADKPALPDALERTRVTVSLGELSAEERARVVDDAFAVRAKHVARVTGRHVLLVDDVLTSGATCAACARALFAAGATAVNVLVAARVPDPRLG